jgi:kynurenine formamidase
MFSWDGSAQEKRKTGNREQPLADIPDLTFMDNFFQNHLVVDLSHTLNPDIPCWPGDPVTEFETVADLEGDGFFLRRFSMGEHTGTHINAAAGFHPNGATIDEYPPSAFVAPAIVIDVRDEARSNPDYLLRVDKLLEWERQNGPAPARSLALLYTGWQEKWDDQAAYLGNAVDGKMHFPGFDAQSLGMLLTQRGVAGIGIDTHGVDGGLDTTFSANRRVLEQPRVVLENLCNLDRLPTVGATLVIGTLRLKGGSGSPASVLAFLP